MFTHAGSITFGRPSIGRCVVYGLGEENRDLPRFVTMNPPPVGGAALYGSAFLRASFQGTSLNIDEGPDPVESIRDARMAMDWQRVHLAMSRTSIAASSALPASATRSKESSGAEG